MHVRLSSLVSSSSHLTEQSCCCPPNCLSQAYLAEVIQSKFRDELTAMHIADKPLKLLSECAWKARGLKILF